jgi:hypothetical protein
MRHSYYNLFYKLFFPGVSAADPEAQISSVSDGNHLGNAKYTPCTITTVWGIPLPQTGKLG